MVTPQPIRTVGVFHFSDLSDDAKEKARAWYRRASADDTYLADEMVDSLKAACKALGWKLEGYELSTYGRSFVHIDAPRTNSDLHSFEDDPAPMLGARLWKKLLSWCYDRTIGEDGSCPFTGVCYDEDFLDPLRAFLKRPRLDWTMQDLVDACVNSWLSSAISNLEHAESDEAIDENIEANEYEFLEDGRRA
jgi:hypothetical protein